MGLVICLYLFGFSIDTITLPGLEREVTHVIIYIETVQWAVKSFEVIRVTRCPTG